MNVTLIIVTKDRPEEVAMSLQSAAEQTMPWHQVIVVDGVNIDEGEKDALYLVSNLVKTKLPLEYYQSTPGITRQRNVARQHVRSDCDIVLYCDDDTYLQPTVNQFIQDFFSVHPDTIGLTGHIDGEPRATRLKRLVGAFTQTYTHRPYGISHGVFNNINEAASVQQVEWLPGAFMAFHWKRVKDLAFDEWFSGYGLGEDLDFSWRAGQRGALMIDPAIRVKHYHSPRGRDWRTFGCMRVVNRRYILEKHFMQHRRYRWGYWWATVWLLWIGLARAPFSRRFAQEYVGYWQGIWTILFKK